MEPFSDAIPLEAHVERMPIPFRRRATNVARHPVAHGPSLAEASGSPARGARSSSPPIRLTRRIRRSTDAATRASRGVGQLRARRPADGWREFYAYLRGRRSATPPTGSRRSPAGARGRSHCRRFVDWFEKLVYQPAATPPGFPTGSNISSRLRAAEARREGLRRRGILPRPSRLVQLRHRPDADGPRRPAEPEPPAVATLTMLPTQATFNGMPNTRWWAFEDGRTNFGDMKPDTTDLAKLLLIEFGSSMPTIGFSCRYGAGRSARERPRHGGHQRLRRAHLDRGGGRGDDDDWQRWAMFLLSIKGQGHEPADLSLVIPPAAQKVIEGRPLEDHARARRNGQHGLGGRETIPLPSGEPKHGREAADETRPFFVREAERRLGGPPPPPPPAAGAKFATR